MENQYILHSGVKGMKWGVRKQSKRDYKSGKKDAKSRYKQDREAGLARYRADVNSRQERYNKKVNNWDPTGSKRDALEVLSRSREYNNKILDADEERRWSNVLAEESTQAIYARMRNREISSVEKELNVGRPVVEQLDKSSYLPKRSNYKVNKSDYVK